jgi:hypothetical protein
MAIRPEPPVSPGPQPGGEIIFYQTESSGPRIECRFEGETLWLSQALISELFQITVPTVNEHLKGIYADGELHPAATIRKFRMVRMEGTRQVSREIEFYNLEAILAVGYRVRSARGTAFRQWATARLQEYLVKGFVMDDVRLKNPPGLGVPDYFDELLERIRDIRASEKRVYLKLRDLFTLAADYGEQPGQTQHYFQVLQNKLHWAVTQQTAAELIRDRADHTKPNMGLTAWKGDKARKTDVTVAKNYLRAEEITELNRIVTMYLDYAEDQARRRRVLYLKDWQEKLDAFLQFNERDILTHAGKIEKAVADKLAENEYDQFQVLRLKTEEEVDTKALEEVLRTLPREKP